MHAYKMLIGVYLTAFQVWAFRLRLTLQKPIAEFACRIYLPWVTPRVSHSRAEVLINRLRPLLLPL